MVALNFPAKIVYPGTYAHILLRFKNVSQSLLSRKNLSLSLIGVEFDL